MTTIDMSDALRKAEEREKGFGRCAICMSENTLKFNENPKGPSVHSQNFNHPPLLFTFYSENLTHFFHSIFPTYPPPLPLQSDTTSTATISTHLHLNKVFILTHSRTYNITPSFFLTGSVQRPLLLLSCSHVFHEQCVLTFEEFLRSSDVSMLVINAILETATFDV